MMKLEQQDIEFRLGLAGVDQKTSDKFAPLGRATELVNVRFPKTGAITKRFGLHNVNSSTFSNFGTISRLLPCGSHLLAIGKDNSGIPAAWKLQRSPTHPFGASFARCSTNRIVSNAYLPPPVPKAWVQANQSAGSYQNDDIRAVDCAVGATQTLYVYQVASTSGLTLYSIVDNETRQVIEGDKRLANGGLGTAKVYAASVPGTDVFVVAISGTAPTTVTVYAIRAGTDTDRSGNYGVAATGLSINANYAWDFALFGSVAVVAYRTNGATTVTVSKATLNTTALTWGAWSSSAATAITAAGPTTVSVMVPYTTTEDVIVVTNDATNGLKAATFSVSTLAVVNAAWTIDSTSLTRNHVTGSRLADGTFSVISELDAADDWLISVTRQTVAVGGAASATTLISNAYLASKPIVSTWTANPVIVVAHLSKAGASYGLQHARILVDLGGSTLATFLRGDADLPPTKKSIASLPSISPHPGDTSVFGSPVIEYECASVRLVETIASQDGTTRRQNFSSFRFSTHAKDGYISAADGDTLLIQAGFLVLYDGVTLCENGFLLYPEIISATASNGAGTLPNNGSFKFVAIYTYVDGRGQLHRSAPSEVVSGATGAADDTFTLSVRGLVFSSKGSYGVEIYRTEDDGEIFYLATAVYGKRPGSDTTISFTITGSDTTLISSTPLRQQQGILDNEQTCCPVTVATNGNRFHLIGGADRQLVREGKERRAGEGAAFFDGKYRRVSADGELVALASSGERWAAFSRRQTYIASGAGADDAGQADTLSDFDQHPTIGVGCINPRTIVQTPLGTIFQSEKGLYILEAGGAITPIGVGIDDYKDFPVRSVAFNSTRNEVVFFLVDGPRLILSLHETEQGIQPRWSTDEDDESATTYGEIAVVDGILYAAAEDRVGGQSLTALKAEDIGSYSDQSSAFPIVMRVTTGWIPLTWARLYEARFLGTVQEAHTARVRAAYDFVDTWIDDKSITSANATAGGTAPYEWAFRPTRPRARAIKLQFTETLESASRGCELNSIVLTVGMLPGKKRLQSRQRAVA